MTHYDELLTRTAVPREAFLATPLIRRALAGDIRPAEYRAYLGQAYHHVKHTCNLLALAASRCGEGDRRLQEALFEYIQEERGHERWILDDIAALGGDRGAVAAAQPGTACAAMVGYAYYAIEHISPYSLLGMVHVLEGVSAGIADSAAQAIAKNLGRPLNQGGFSYLTSHGALDQDHVAFFCDLVNGIADPRHRAAIIDTARIMYGLFGNIFQEVEQIAGRETADAA